MSQVSLFCVFQPAVSKRRFVAFFDIDFVRVEWTDGGRIYDDNIFDDIINMCVS